MEFKEGQKVHYSPEYGEKENGIVKMDARPNAKIIFVVYKCCDDWSNYRNYTSQATESQALKDGWIN